MMCIMKSVFAVLLISSMILVNRVDCGSCRESTLCCNGRDSSCVVQKAPINSIIEDLNDKPCYCDHACLKLGDFCNDFKQYCGETALLLPAELSKSRHENDTVDIQRNLRLRYRDTFKHNRDHEYCIEFEVIKASKACHKLPPYNKLAEGDRVVIRCDLEALQKDTETEEITDNSSIHDDSPKFRCRGEGLPGRNTRWNALAAPSCRGKWLRLTVGQPKKCTDSQFIFI